jgi:pilus assembly protein CpaE
MQANGDGNGAVTWRPLVACPQAEIARQLRSALQELGIADARHISEYPRTGTIVALAAKHECNICFLDVASNEEHALLLISEAAAAIPVVALNPRDDADLILRCLRRGACEFLSHPVAEPVRSLFERLARGRARTPGNGAGALYCVIPGKPGCGASALAAHLAIQMGAGGGRRGLLVDLDSLTGSIGFMLKLKSEFHLGDVLLDWKRMDEDLWRRMTAPSSGIDVLLAPDNPSTRIEVGRQLAGELAAFWRDRYDTVVVDTPDVRAAAESGFAAVADHVLVVTTNELAAVHATRRAIDYLEQLLRERTRIRLIVNRYVPATGIRHEDLKTALQMEPFAILGKDYETMQTALLEGKPAPPESRFRIGVEALSRQLRGEADRPAKKAGFSFHLFRHRT